MRAPRSVLIPATAFHLAFNAAFAPAAAVAGLLRRGANWSGAELAQMQALRRAVVQKVGAQARPNPMLASCVDGLDIPLRAQHPDVRLYSFDEHDAAAWGCWFGARVADWLARFGAAPETLDPWCRRVLWPR